MDREAQQRIMGFFIEEARDHLVNIEQGLLCLQERASDKELINDLFRGAHSIKGGAAMLGVSSIQNTAHRMEDIFNVFRERSVPVDRKLESLLLRCYDTLASLLDKLQSPEGLSPEAGEAAMTETEPVFQQLDLHMKVLLGDLSPEAAADQAGTETETVQSNKKSPSQQDAFQQYVPRLMREMLDLFKQEDTADTRARLAEIGQSLIQLGDTYQLPGWTDLCYSIDKSIANPANGLAPIARQVLPALKQAQQMVLAGSSENIVVSSALSAMASTASVDSAPSHTNGIDGMGLPDLLHEVPQEVDEGTAADGLADLLMPSGDLSDISSSEVLAADEPRLTNDLSQAQPAAELTELFGGDTSGLLDPVESVQERLTDLFSGSEVDNTDTDSFEVNAIEEESTADLAGLFSSSSEPVLDSELEFGELNLAADSSPADVHEDNGDLTSLLSDPNGDVAANSALEDAAPLDDLSDLSQLLADSSLEALPAPVSEAFEDLSELDSLVADSLEPTSASPASPADANAEAFANLEKLIGEGPSGVKPSSAAFGARSSASSRQRQKPGFSNPTMRVEVKYLDLINNLVGEMVVSRNSLEQNQTRLQQFLENMLFRVRQLGELGQKMQDRYERSLLEASLLRSTNAVLNPSSNDESHSTGEDFDALEMDRFTAFHSLSQEIIELIVRVRESASDIQFVVDQTEQTTRQFRQSTTQLQDNLNRARMVPFSQIADRLPRAIRELSVKTGKQIDLFVEGRDTLIDKAILEELYDPMTHLVNNAIVHGIEEPNEREQAGKPIEGTIKIQTFYQGNQTIIVVSDDGRGINAARVKEKALAQGLLSAEDSADISDNELYDFIFHAGFSTRSQADELAGRGVGMDVVRTRLNELRGAVQVDSVPNQGTTFTIRLPLTLSISKAMVCVSDKALVAFPLDGVEEMVDISPDSVQTDSTGNSYITWQGQQLLLKPLTELFSYSNNHNRSRPEAYSSSSYDDDLLPIAILQSGGHRLAIQVDSFVEEQEIVIKQLGGPAPKPLGIAGATVLGDGRVLPIADILELIDVAYGRTRREQARFWMPEGGSTEPAVEQDAIPTVLIVDDSITVRELLSMTFSKAGYKVEQARDGQDAWDKLRNGLPCSIMFCDVEMPRMDGLELLSRMRKDEQYNKLPIAMLTSRGADRHRQMAAELGANAYFTKPYLEEEILTASKRLIAGEILLQSTTEPGPVEV